ncbi:MAG TPA: agmatinase family protein [Terrimesophilobacter sp.]|nr:agmatinase family protein [Terrimesophilobacter sp.]HRP99368.1 agmatinase family protein [Terrimesophilobacter sp.]
MREFEIIGAPFDGAATLGWPGARYAPDRIRESLSWMLMRPENGSVYSLDTGGLIPASTELLTDGGDSPIIPHDVSASLGAISASVTEVVGRGRVPIVLGGDDSILYAAVRGLHDGTNGSVAVIHFDAHLDLQSENERQGRLSQSSGMRRSLELERVSGSHCIQVGLRHFNFPSSLSFIEEAGPAQITARDFIARGWENSVDIILERIKGADNVFFSFDIDAIDPAYAPGAGAHEPGGITSRDAIESVKALAPHCDGFAITEVNPLKDHHDMTSNLAAYLAYYFAVFGQQRPNA